LSWHKIVSFEFLLESIDLLFLKIKLIFILASYGTKLPLMLWAYKVVDLGFKFKYIGTDYTQVSISSNGYVCLGYNSKCGSYTRPSPHDILVGLNCDLDPTREGSGQIYYKRLDSNSIYFKSFNLFNPGFEPQQIFMITYDNVLPPYWSFSSSVTSFQIYLSTDSVKSFVTFKFKSCPKDITLEVASGLNYIRINGSLQEVIIANGQQCTGSNVGQAGVWVSDVTSRSKLKHCSFVLFSQRIDSKIYNFYLLDFVSGFFNSLNSGIFGCKAFFLSLLNFLHFLFFLIAAFIVLSCCW
jgi:hypothetical protein